MWSMFKTFSKGKCKIIFLPFLKQQKGHFRLKIAGLGKRTNYHLLICEKSKRFKTLTTGL